MLEKLIQQEQGVLSKLEERFLREKTWVEERLSDLEARSRPYGIDINKLNILSIYDLPCPLRQDLYRAWYAWALGEEMDSHEKQVQRLVILQQSEGTLWKQLANAFQRLRQRAACEGTGKTPPHELAALFA
ncbi:hypothetical protein COCSUDRAFT_55004 [Coccomyxa subellipsoidea C-169]|uniref:Uncharacterized protein n=1 Tax=Coccomyxa subellipsoidea (strain C-169) TaxID=574566 RepID=I0YIC9_COCSC|nr:hypothetical protein COCSUDRAFT_55004 [Coccomyxa subellipsoidea C-169]EIE18148.1 hypothetical protein COCSUDRAFT_55004 [Coccomyxa subellipsoidea C-169]|eukprot:XP_005642692.1 hypothetical protein COCSUDRAFT_55004 [Coccomyxa subellipsoidea C-169]